MSNEKVFPSITPVEWLAARDVLGGEASDFTPWLHQNLDVLGTALKLEDLTAGEMEHNVLGKRLDILATAVDEDGQDIAVCIENQYGTSDADHLGRLIAYLAQHDRGRAVWIVEHAHDAFVAAVRFLNRTSSDAFGYYMVQVRFTHGAAGGYQVHYEVLAAPIAWEGERGGHVHTVNANKLGHVLQLHDAMQSELLGVGFPNVRTPSRGAFLAVGWPLDLWFRQYAKRLTIRVQQKATVINVFVRTLGSGEANREAIAIMKQAYETELASRVPASSVIDWHPTGAGNSGIVRVALPGAGYPAGDIDETATWAIDVCRIWLELLRDHPIGDLTERVQQAVPVSDDADVDDGSDEDEA